MFGMWVYTYLFEVLLVVAVAALTPARYTAASFTATPLTSFAPAVRIQKHTQRNITHREKVMMSAATWSQALA
jgi:hypothetical protein